MRDYARGGKALDHHPAIERMRIASSPPDIYSGLPAHTCPAAHGSPPWAPSPLNPSSLAVHAPVDNTRNRSGLPVADYGLRNSLFILLGSLIVFFFAVPRFHYPKVKRFCFTREDFNKEYGLSFEGEPIHTLSQENLSEFKWLSVFSRKREKGMKFFLLDFYTIKST